ncbi:hypothetical protein HYS28_01820 [Candidatus Uhrbacteria bacterium]|nr:hypothetical protein [Candidatus Uhrbacteria bacterium]
MTTSPALTLEELRGRFPDSGRWYVDGCTPFAGDVEAIIEDDGGFYVRIQPTHDLAPDGDPVICRLHWDDGYHLSAKAFGTLPDPAQRRIAAALQTEFDAPAKDDDDDPRWKASYFRRNPDEDEDR